MWAALVSCFVACSGSSKQAKPAQELDDNGEPVEDVHADWTLRDAAPAPDAREWMSMAEIEGNAPGQNTCEPFDVKNPACRSDPRMCTIGMADCKCPAPPDVANPACWGTMPCPNPPDRRVRACRQFMPPCPDNDHPDPRNPHCPEPRLTGRVLKSEQRGDRDLIITIGVGTEQGLSKNWKASLANGDTSDALPGGEITILRVERRMTVGVVHVDQPTLLANSRVRFDAP
ncbi:MAG TPA: hypothetical protein VGM90_13590 [Kofleriaceae bacterium]|jgi:hypothetical protein